MVREVRDKIWKVFKSIFRTLDESKVGQLQQNLAT